MNNTSQTNIVQYPRFGRLHRLPKLAQSIMILDDDDKYPLLLQANLNILHNYAADIIIMRSLGRAIEEMRSVHPCLIFSSSALRHHPSFQQIVRYIRQAGYSGPIIACSAAMTNDNRKDLMADGATWLLDRANTHTGSVVEAIEACLAGQKVNGIG